jgi:hypothetical protein
MSDSAPLAYEFRVERHLGPALTAHFPGFTVAHEKEGTTLLRGSVPDQAALHGVLARIRDLGLTLLELRQVATPGSSQVADGER